MPASTQTKAAKAAKKLSARHMGAFNWVGLKTLIAKEVGRFVSVYTQTIVAPVITTLLFYTVFMLAFGGVQREVGEVSFLNFLAPGLIMMTMAQNAYANTSSSLVIAKVQGNIVDVLMPPLSSLELMIGYLTGSVLRGLVIGVVSVLVVGLFVGLPIDNIFYILSFAVLGTMMMGALGVIGGIWSEKFDHIAAFSNFVITPLTFLSGTFYSIHTLPDAWEKFALFNPVFYMIDGFRAGFITQADAPPETGLIVLLITNAFLCAVIYRMLDSGYKIKS